MTGTPPTPIGDHPSDGFDSFALWEANASPPVQPGTTIGRYRIIEMLGEGGMGRVYLAEQSGALRRHVAIKLLKASADAAHILERFRFEQQTLARLSHPAVAQVLDAAETTDGSPYFVMEYVPGLPVTAYADKHGLSIDDRLRLFIDICAGIRHAHGRSILHRDIKPSNILVRRENDAAVPKVIDWGIAHAIDFAEPRHQQEPQPVGTPEYMSPEQARRLALDVRTDIYSLGVVLYELLCGRLPLDPGRLRTAPDLAVAIETSVPPPPSERLEMDEARAEVARRRATDASALQRRLRHDLDRVVMRAMAPHADRRFGSVDELVAACRVCLDDIPHGAGTRARPGWARWVVGGAAAALLLAAGILIGVRLTAAPGKEDGGRGPVTPPPMAPAAEGTTWAERYAAARDAIPRRTISTQVDAFPSQVAATPDGRRAVTVEAGSAVLYDLDAMQLLTRLGAVTGHRACVAASADSQLIATIPSGATNRVDLWSAGDGTLAASITLPRLPLAVRFAPGGDLLIAGEGQLTLHEASAWQEKASVALPTGEMVEDVRLLPEGGAALLAMSESGLLLVDLASTPLVRPLIAGTGAFGAAASSDGRLVAGAMADGSVRVVEVETGREVARLERHGLPPTAVAFGIHGTRLASADPERLVLWDVDVPRMVQEWRGVGLDVSEHAFDSASGQFLAEDIDGGALLVNARDGAIEARLGGGGGGLTGIEFVAGGSAVVGATVDGHVHHWLLNESGADVLVSAPDRWIRNASWIDGGRLVTASGHPTNRLTEHQARLKRFALDEYDGVTGAHVREIAALPAAPLWMETDAAGTIAAVALEDGAVHVVDLSSGAEVESLRSPVEGALLQLVCVRGDGAWLLAADDAERLHLWEREGGAIRTFADEAMTLPVSAIAMDEGGRFVAAASRDRLVRIWDASSGELLHRVEPLNAFATDLHFSADARWLAASGGLRGAVLDLASRERVLLTDSLDYEALSVTLAPGENSLVLGATPFVQVVDIATGEARLRLPCAPDHEGPPLYDDMRELAFDAEVGALLVVHDGRVHIFRASPR